MDCYQSKNKQAKHKASFFHDLYNRLPTECMAQIISVSFCLKCGIINWSSYFTLSKTSLIGTTSILEFYLIQNVVKLTMSFSHHTLSNSISHYLFVFLCLSFSLCAYISLCVSVWVFPSISLSLSLVCVWCLDLVFSPSGRQRHVCLPWGFHYQCCN